MFLVCSKSATHVATFEDVKKLYNIIIHLLYAIMYVSLSIFEFYFYYSSCEVCCN